MDLIIPSIKAYFLTIQDRFIFFWVCSSPSGRAQQPSEDPTDEGLDLQCTPLATGESANKETSQGREGGQPENSVSDRFRWATHNILKNLNQLPIFKNQDVNIHLNFFWPLSLQKLEDLAELSPHASTATAAESRAGLSPSGSTYALFSSQWPPSPNFPCLAHTAYLHYFLGSCSHLSFQPLPRIWHGTFPKVSIQYSLLNCTQPNSN